MLTNETITLNDKTGLEIDFTNITYKDGAHHGLTWFTATLDPVYTRTLCGKAGIGTYTVTEDELDGILTGYLNEVLKSPVSSFRWQWDTFYQSNVA